jgi:hypothetical protein
MAYRITQDLQRGCPLPSDWKSQNDHVWLLCVATTQAPWAGRRSALPPWLGVQ